MEMYVCGEQRDSEKRGACVERIKKETEIVIREEAHSRVCIVE